MRCVCRHLIGSTSIRVVFFRIYRKSIQKKYPCIFILVPTMNLRREELHPAFLHPPRLAAANPRANLTRGTMMLIDKNSLMGPVPRMASVRLSAIWGKIWPVPSQEGVQPWIRIFPQTTGRESSCTSNAVRRIAHFSSQNADGLRFLFPHAPESDQNLSESRTISLC